MLKLIVAAFSALIMYSTPVFAQSAQEFAIAGMGMNHAISTPASHSKRSVTRRRASRAPLDIRTAPQIVADAARYIGTRNPYHFRGPGCKAFINMIARRTGYVVNASLRAIDVAGMGVRVTHPQPGDYRYTTRYGGGHAEIVAVVHGNTLDAINGNKGRNRVGWSRRSIAGAAYYRPIPVRMAGI